ncbi:MAG: 50S ribosomal protein L11 methyltransferase [Desulfatiglandaceae bacterium]|jgi:ribosomal protein L11 methylase PrmA
MEFEISVEGPSQAIEALARLLEGVAFQTKTVPPLEPDFPPLESICIYESSPDSVDRRLLELSPLIDKVETEGHLRDCLKLRVRNLAYSEPRSGSERFLEPFNPIPSLTIHPWPSHPIHASDQTSIILYPHNAFGTGKHPTTRLSLEILASVARGNHGTLAFPECSVLDFGCGTGILAIAALKLGAKDALGIEIDAQSAKTALRNVELNRLSQNVRVEQGSWDRVGGAYELILANVVPSALFRTGNAIPTHLKQGGLAIVSGFGENLLEDMAQFFLERGLVTLEQFRYEAWGALLMAHPS